MANNPSAQYDLLVASGLQYLACTPDSKAYQDRQASYWAANVPLRPACIVQPRTTEEVSRVVRVLAKADGPLALRSGGHTQWAGSNDVANGVTIDLGQMTGVTYDERTKLASVQPGLRWKGVYQELLKHGVCVTGGRDGSVGVGGFLTGGGISYHAGENGLGCDNVANFEVVLATGEIVNASADEHADLWTALKGGSGNFGIVTRFDLCTFPAPDVWGGARIATRDHGDEFAQWTVDFTNGYHETPHAATILNYTFNLGIPGMVSIAQMVVDTKGVPNSSAFEKTLNVPTVHNTLQKQSMANLAANSTLRAHQHQVWFTLTFKNHVDIITHAAKLHDTLVSELQSLIPSDHFSTQCIFQPWPVVFAEHSVRRGGNVLGLDNIKENALLWAVVGSTDTPEEHEIMREKITAYSAALEAFGEDKGLGLDWRYINYVDQTQDPLKSYGKGNVEFMRRVAAKYDPDGVFQKKVVSGWKLSNVVV